MIQERSVLIDEETFYACRDLSEELEEWMEELESDGSASDERSQLLERAAGLLRELTWKYEGSLNVEREEEEV